MEMGLFGHVPSAEEIEAKAFITTQEPWRDQWSWPAYIAGLADAGVGDERGACAECEYHYTDRMRELGVDA